ncbi:MAG: 50S ribosomal protein L25/general stress protein Ctc [Actinomycetota bacterium]|nr:50S ribosomal protein L25/general stress protein Ctc [Actinomycetota bacterium]
MSQTTIAAEPRTEFGKGAARRIRRTDKVPAVLYGHGADPLHLSLPTRDLMLALRNPNALLSIAVEGSAAQLALARQVQRHPIKGSIEHADLLVVRTGEKVVVDIPVLVTGDALSDALVVTETAQLSVEADATALPDSVEVSVEGLGVGVQIHAGDIALPEGTVLAVDADVLVVNVVAAPTAEEVEAELVEAEADAGIERDESDAAAEAAETATESGSQDDATSGAGAASGSSDEG